MSQAREQRLVQELIAHPAVEAFDGTILGRLTRRDVIPVEPNLTGRVATSTTRPRYRTSPRDDENGRCSGSSHRAMRSASSPPIAASTTTSSSAVIASLPHSTVLPETALSAPGTISLGLLPWHSRGVPAPDSHQSFALNPTTPLCLLQPYSPDFNPIKNAFSKLKALLRKAAACTIQDLRAAIAKVLPQFTPAECANYFTTCGYEPE